MVNFYVLELCCFEWFQNIEYNINHRQSVLELCCFEWFQNIVYGVVDFVGVLELCCFEWFQNAVADLSKTSCVLELCCFEWFQPILKATHFLSSFFLIQDYILLVTNPFPCREARLRVLRTTLTLPVSD